MWEIWRRTVYVLVFRLQKIAKDCNRCQPQKRLCAHVATLCDLQCLQCLVWHQKCATYILKAGFLGFWNPQMTLNFSQRDFLRMQKNYLSEYLKKSELCNVLEMKVTKCLA